MDQTLGKVVMRLIRSATQRSTTQAYSYLALLFCWACLTAIAAPVDLPRPSVSLAFVLLGMAWANSSFDPMQDSKAHLMWQYAAPWVFGGMSFLTGPIGLFLGALTGSAMVGFMTGIGLGAVLCGVLLFWACIAASAYYTFHQSLDPERNAHPSTAKRLLQHGLTRRSELHLSSAIISLFWSFFQGLTITGLMVMGIKLSGLAGLLGMLLWTLLMVLTVMRFHLAARGKLGQKQRFLLLWGAIASGGLVGLFLA